MDNIKNIHNNSTIVSNKLNSTNQSFVDMEFINPYSREDIKNSANKVFKVVMNKLGHHENLKSKNVPLNYKFSTEDEMFDYLMRKGISLELSI